MTGRKKTNRVESMDRGRRTVKKSTLHSHVSLESHHCDPDNPMVQPFTGQDVRRTKLGHSGSQQGSPANAYHDEFPEHVPTMWEELAKNVTAIGLARIADHRCSVTHRAFWAVVFLSALSFTTYVITLRVTTFLSKPILVDVRRKTYHSMPFPSVTICNVNAFSLRASQAVPGMQDLVQKAFPIDLLQSQTSSSHLKNQTDKHAVFTMFDEHHDTVLDSKMEYLGLLMCRWGRSVCSVANFTSVLTDMGHCQTFNLDGTVTSLDSGRAYGLRLSLDTKQDDYLRSFDQYYGAGYRVTVHEPGVPPVMAKKGVAISPGFHNFLAIQVQDMQNADPSVSQCAEKKLRYHTFYSTEACIFECFIEFMGTTCGCRDAHMPNTQLRICDSHEHRTCFSPASELYLQGDNQCEKQCPEPCSSTVYRVTASSNPLTNTYLAHVTHVTGRGSADYWQRNLVYLEIYLTSLTNDMVQKRLSYTSLELFCDVGGAFGLLLGASLLTVLEIVDFFCRVSPSGPNSQISKSRNARTGRGGMVWRMTKRDSKNVTNGIDDVW